MADEIIGSLGVQIEADASDLKGQYDVAVAESENAAERIAGAFEAVVGIGEALAITEGLKEFGQEALNAYGTVQSVTIGLTQLTKSASEANDIVEQIKNLAATEPFAFPEIAPTVQKMVALGIAAEQIPATMQAVADASAATGNSFQAVANSIDRIALSGTLSTRALTNLGLSMSDIAKAMGVTDDMAKALFKDLDEAERVDILNQALTKFAGSAIAQAQGIKGEWQLFQNQFEEVMVGVGDALAPAASAILSFGKDALSAAQTAIDAFNKLPEPLRDLGGAAVIAVAALAPLAVAAGTIGLGITGLTAAIAPLNELLVTLGLRSGEAVIAEEAEAVAAGNVAVAEGERAIATEAAAAATVTAGEGAAAAGIGITAMGAAAAAAGIAISALIGFEIGKWAAENIPLVADLGNAFNNLAGKILPNYTESLEALRVQFGVTTPEIRSEQDEIKNLQAQLGVAGVKLQQFDDENEHFISVLRDVRQQLADTTKEGLDPYGAALDALLKKHKDLGVELEAANGILAVAQQRYADDEISAAQLAEAQKNLLDVQKKLNALNPEYAETLGGITEAYDKQQAKIAALQTTKEQLLAIEGRSVQQDQELVDVENKLTTAINGHKSAIDNLPKAYDGLVASGDQFLKKQRDISDSVAYAKAVLDGLTASEDTSKEHQGAVTAALQQYIDKLKQSGAAMSDQITITVNGVQVVTTLGDAINQVKQGQGDWNTVTVNGVQVLRDHVSAVTNSTGAVTSHTAAVQGATLAHAAFHAALQTITDDVSRALNYFNPLSASIKDVGVSASGTVDNLDSAAASVDQLGADAAGNVDNMSQFANSIDGVTNSVGQMSQALDNADRSMQQFASGTEGALGKTTAEALGAWALAAQFNGVAAFQGSGSAKNSQGQFVSALDELFGNQQSTANANAAKAFQDTFGISLQQYQAQIDAAYKATQQHTTAITANTSATNINATAVTGKTTATTAAATATGTLTTATTATTTALATAVAAVTQYNGLLNNSSTVTTDALGNVTTAYTTTTKAAQTFVDGLGNVYNSYQALVDAIKNNPLLAGPAFSQSGSGVSGSGASSAPAQQYVDGMGNVYSSLQALQQALAANPGLAGPHIAAGATQTITPASGGSTNQIFILGGQQVSLAQFLNSLGSGGGFSTGPTPVGSSFGLPSSVLSNQSGAPITINLHYPQFNTQQQAQQIMNQIVSQLRTVTGIKL